MKRCAWAGSDPLYVTYHDEEWGVPAHDDRHLFEMLILEGAQAGLSWITILRKRGLPQGLCRFRPGKGREVRRAKNRATDAGRGHRAEPPEDRGCRA